MIEQLTTFLQQNPSTIFWAILWMLPWKGWALWAAAKNNQRIWFSVILFFQTLAILEIIYLIFFRKKR